MFSLKFKRLIVYAGFIFLSFYLGLKIINEGWLVPLILFSALIYSLIQNIFRIRVEALFLSFLVFGYIVGNRGFAQITPFGNLPLFLGEIGLFTGLILILSEIPLKKETPFRLDSLSISILVWVSAGILWIFRDIKEYGLLALRDFALVYYALFFIVAQPMSRNQRSLKLFEITLAVALILLLILYPVYNKYRDLFFTYLYFDNAPLIAYKGDLAGTFLGVGFFYFYFIYAKRKNILLFLLVAGFFIMTFMATTRAAMVGLGAASIFIFLTQHYKPYLRMLAILFLIAIPVIPIYFHYNDDYTQTKIYAIYEHAKSIFDISGTGEYHNQGTLETGSNNRYRLVWWKTLFKQTVNEAPILGFGFGYDLSDKFVLTYYNAFLDNWTVRSPHSVILTVFARMGLVGFTMFMLIVALALRNTYRSVQLSRIREEMMPSLAYWCMAWTVFVSACFGVVLEGPMGAVLFWSFLGIANVLVQQEMQEASVSKMALSQEEETAHKSIMIPEPA